MTLNGVIAHIVLYFTELVSFAGLLRHSGWRQTYIVCRISSSAFAQNWTTLHRGLSAIAELLVQNMNSLFSIWVNANSFSHIHSCMNGLSVNVLGWYYNCRGNIADVLYVLLAQGFV